MLYLLSWLTQRTPHFRKTCVYTPSYEGVYTHEYSNTAEFMPEFATYSSDHYPEIYTRQYSYHDLLVILSHLRSIIRNIVGG